MNRRFFYLVIIVIFAALILGGFFYFQNWQRDKQEKIKLGLAENKFPYREYTQEELSRMYPQIKNADVPTRITPEQTYAKFREALRTNNLDMAIEQLSKESEKYEENKVDLEFAHKENRFVEVYKSYPENIIKENISESYAQHFFNYKEGNIQRTHFVSFIKDSSGDWKLDNL